MNDLLIYCFIFPFVTPDGLNHELFRGKLLVHLQLYRVSYVTLWLGYIKHTWLDLFVRAGGRRT